LQCQVCQVATRKEYDNFGDNINYIAGIYSGCKSNYNDYLKAIDLLSKQK